jgi:PAS domain S-box-containing protein
LQRIYDVLDIAQLVVFVGLGLISFIQWRRRGGASAGWLAATFGVLASVVIGGRFVPMSSTASWVDLAVKVELAVLVLFPYFLYRFMASFDPPPRLLDAVAVGLTTATIVYTFFLGHIPQQGETYRPPIFVGYIVLLLVDWVVLSLAVAIRLWRAGRGQPTVARRRMRTLSLGSIGLAVVLVIAGTASGSGEVTVAQVVTQVLGILSAILFLLGFAPPGIVRLAWRRKEEKQLRDAELGLMEAVSPNEVAGALLPHVSRLVGGRGAVLTGTGGEVVGAYGLDRVEAAELARTVASATPRDHGGALSRSVLSVPLRSGALAVQASTYTPFFGREETEMLQTLAVLAELALARAELFGRERESRDQLAEAQQIARIGSWEMNVATKEIVWSDEMYRIYGVDPDEFTPRYESLVGFSVDAESMQARMQETIELDVPLDAEQTIVKPDGSEAVLYARGKVVRREGEPIKMIGTAQDITERKKQEAFREQFIANAAHELRTPMTTLVGFVEMLSRKRNAMPEEQIKVIVEAMSRSGDRLAVLINNLLDLSKLQQGELDFELAPVSVEEVLASARESAPPPPGKSVDIKVEGNPVALADRHRLDQVLSNLLTNAYRYGGSEVRIEACEKNGAVVLTVADNGQGIEEGLASSLFDPFTRGAASSEVGGSGLGLAIVKMLVDASGGEIWHEREEPHGARFNVRLKRPS